MIGGVDQELEREWERLLGSWDDADAHKRFLVLAESTGRLAFAGTRYRSVKESKESTPERRAEAEKRIGEILVRAVAQMKVERPEPAVARSRVEWIAYGISAALIAAALWQLFRYL
jgi:hypothetical protein